MCKQYQLIFITFCRTKHLTFRVLKQKKIRYFQRSDGNEPHHPDYERRSGRQYAKLLEITICHKNIARIANAVQVTICLLVSTSVY